MRRKPKVRWGALSGALVTLAGVVASPAVLAVVGPKAAGVIIALGAILQGATKPVVRKEEERYGS